MLPFGPELAPRAALTAAALALIVSLVNGREAAEAKPDPPAEGAAPSSDRVEPAIEASVVVGSVREALPPPSPRRAPPAPAAPPLPFSYLGKMIDGDKTHVFVGRGADHYSVEPGLTIDDTYKVEKITDTTVTFLFLPTRTRQVLAVPSLSE
jgi:hypothetical protein